MKSLRERIKDSGLTKKHIAAALGIAPATLSRIISGKQAFVSEALSKKIDDYLASKNA